MDTSLEFAIKKLLKTWKSKSPYAQGLRIVLRDWSQNLKKTRNNNGTSHVKNEKEDTVSTNSNGQI